MAQKMLRDGLILQPALNLLITTLATLIQGQESVA